MNIRSHWADASLDTGMYESFYMRAASPRDEAGVWIRYTVQKAPGKAARASLWFTMFDSVRGRPVARKQTVERADISSPETAWIKIGDSSIGPDRIEGSAGDASWSLTFDESDLPLKHLQRDWLYRSGLPKTKPESPVPYARFRGVVENDGQRYDIDGWPGMIGHNWGLEHAWTWIWLSGAGFDEDHSAWIDVALGRVKLAGRTTPWIANGAFSTGGKRHRVGGIFRRHVEVDAEPGKAKLVLPGDHGYTAKVNLSAPRESTVAWHYGSPGGHIHDVLNCGIAALDLEILGGGARRLHTDHGGTYELGLPGRQGWVEPETIPDEW